MKKTIEDYNKSPEDNKKVDVKPEKKTPPKKNIGVINRVKQ